MLSPHASGCFYALLLLLLLLLFVEEGVNDGEHDDRDGLMYYRFHSFCDCHSQDFAPRALYELANGGRPAPTAPLNLRWLRPKPQSVPQAPLIQRDELV